MPVRAKLYVSEVKRQASNPDHVTVTLSAVTRGEENKTWAEATPSARFEMTINNPEAAASFTLGQELYVTFEAAEPVPSLADGHAFEPRGTDSWNSKHCARCGCRQASHDEPLRSRLLASVRF